MKHKILNIKKQWLLILGLGFFQQNALADILFINVNENTSEEVIIKQWAEAQKCNQNAPCEKVHVIQNKNSRYALDETRMMMELDQVLNQAQKENRVIDKLIVSGHSDGEYYSGAKGTSTEANIISISAVQNAVAYTQSLNKYSDSRLNRTSSVAVQPNLVERARFMNIQSVLLMGCHSFKLTHRWFKNIPSVESVVSTDAVWPLGQSSAARKWIPMSLDLGQSIKESNFKKSIHEDFEEGLGRQAFENHSLVLSYRLDTDFYSTIKKDSGKAPMEVLEPVSLKALSGD